jgi:hypothetical protein
MKTNNPMSLWNLGIRVGLGVLAAMAAGCALPIDVVPELGDAASEQPSGEADAEGDAVEVVLRVNAADADHLACAYGEQLEGWGCSFQSPDVAWEETPSTGTLVPLSTVGAHSKVLLVGAYWNDVAVQQVAGACPSPFFTRCKFHGIGQAGAVFVRWSEGDDWEVPEYPASIGTVSECTFEPPEPWLTDDEASDSFCDAAP